MVFNNSPPTADQQDLIKSLQSKFAEDPPLVPLTSQKNLSTKKLCTLGSISDNLRIIKHYICSCGSSTETMEHSTKVDSFGKILDSYHLNCKSCGKEEMLQFKMLRKYLDQHKKETTSTFIKKSALYPYL